MCSIVYEPCDENSFKIGPPIGGGGDFLNSYWYNTVHTVTNLYW